MDSASSTAPYRHVMKRNNYEEIKQNLFHPAFPSHVDITVFEAILSGGPIRRSVLARKSQSEVSKDNYGLYQAGKYPVFTTCEVHNFKHITYAQLQLLEALKVKS